MLETASPIRGTNDFCSAHVALEQPEQLRPIFTDVGGIQALLSFKLQASSAALLVVRADL
jgi:hypothetical protein